MAALFLDLQPGDEVIMPSFTFVSTANAFVLRGAIPVFVDIRSDTLNIDENLIAAAITDKTKAIIPVHYAGVPCNMQPITEIASKYKIAVVEDAAQGLGSTYKGSPVGSMGDFATFSFHQTKNLISGEGGALMINSKSATVRERAEIIREKGTNRSLFIRGEVDKYTWKSLGSSYLPSELIAAFLWGQLSHIDDINLKRKELWYRYHNAFSENDITFRTPSVPEDCNHNGHIYYIIFPSDRMCEAVRKHLLAIGVELSYHYVPLHLSQAGKKFCRQHGILSETENIWSKLLRLPLSPSITFEKQNKIIRTIIESSKKLE